MTRALSDPDNTDAEFAVLVRSDLKGVGLGRQLLEKMIAYARAHGLTRLSGITMPNNRGMIALAQRLGFGIEVQRGRHRQSDAAAAGRRRAVTCVAMRYESTT